MSTRQIASSGNDSRRATRAVRAGGALPSDDQVRSTRRLVMIEAHLLALIPLLAVFLARGVGTR